MKNYNYLIQLFMFNSKKNDYFNKYKYLIIIFIIDIIINFL